LIIAYNVILIIVIKIIIGIVLNIIGIIINIIVYISINGTVVVPVRLRIWLDKIITLFIKSLIS
jgi:hypothetical protein